MYLLVKINIAQLKLIVLTFNQKISCESLFMIFFILKKYMKL